MKTKRIPILLVEQHPLLQPRACLDEDAIADYAAAYKSGAKLPPLEVYWINRVRPVVYHVTDGWHRLAALRRCSAKEADCIVHNGTLQEAHWAALAANKTHGLRRTTADKERAVRAALRHPMATKNRLSDRRIAEHVGVSDKTVAKYRAEMVAGAEIPHVNSRQGKDGKAYQVPDKKVCGEAPEAAQVPKQISVPPGGDLVHCRCCGAMVDPDEDGDCPECHEPEIAVMPSPPILKPRAYLDQDGEMGQVVAVIHGLNDKWISARGRHRVKSPQLPPRPTWEEAQADLDAYAAERGWKEYATDQPVDVDEPPAVEEGEPLADRPEWFLKVASLSLAAIEVEGRPAVAGRLQHLADEILMG